ncbi:MAG: hypothetical protein IPH35_03465 [Rhodoferax sp.]|nr:hypothetical protein [Rhodoferax sp.]
MNFPTQNSSKRRQQPPQRAKLVVSGHFCMANRAVRLMGYAGEALISGANYKSTQKSTLVWFPALSNKALFFRGAEPGFEQGGPVGNYLSLGLCLAMRQGVWGHGRLQCFGYVALHL